MFRKLHLRIVGVLAIGGLLGYAVASGQLDSPLYAQQPVATATKLEQRIPEQLPAWKGTIGKTLKDSKPYFLPSKKAPPGAPNVLLVMLDDGGWSHMSAFGGPINTLGFDRIAREGLRYTHVGTTALCSPTRASLLTGHNHHALGAGVITEFSAGYPGYNNLMDDSRASIAKILGANGYATSAFGKWHNTPADQASPVGPFQNWPTGRWGFEYFYGFLSGETNQFHPLLVQNTTSIETPKTNADGSPYHLTHDLADQAIRWLDNWQALREAPFFMYWAPGAVHAPIHVPEDWRDKYKGKFDHGWDAYRVEAFERQKKLGLFPKDAKLPPRPDSIPNWDDYTDKERAFLARQMEVAAAFVEHTDFHAKRLIDHLEQMGQLDNTLVIYLSSDNGASSEGTLSGSFSEILMQNGFPPLSLAKQMEMVDHYGGLEAWGGPEMNNHYPAAWAWAANSPYPWVKQVASHFGTMASTAIRYPKLIKDAGGIRRQFHHVTDIVPTILEVTGVPKPDEVNGIKQRPLDGASMAYSFTNEKAPTSHPTQYFEMLGYRGVYHQGWMASAVPYRVPWTSDEAALAKLDVENGKWELYDIDGGDWTQAVNVADKHPDKLKELRAIFEQEAKRNNVYPIGGSFAKLAQPESDPQLGAAKNRWVLNANVYRVPELSGPNLKSRDFKVTADLQVGEKTEGVIFATGDLMGGMTLYIKDRKLKFFYSMLGLYTYEVASNIDVPEGEVMVELTHTMIEKKPSGSAHVEILINGKKAGETNLKVTVPGAFSAHEPFDVGRDSGSPVTRDYKDHGLFNFTGRIKQVVFDLN